MRKKLLVVISALCVLISLGFAATLQTKAIDAGIQAGFARVDINPYVVDGDYSSGIMALPLAGSGDVWNRLSRDTLMDDNGDGSVNAKDGLKATVIAVSDKDGDTLLLITVDVMAMTFSTQITEEVIARVEAEQAAGNLTDVKLKQENIYAASTHTHNAPDTTSYKASGRTGTNNAGLDIGKLNEDLGLWIDRTVEDIGDAAIAALKDRAKTTITKDQLSASDATAEVVAGKTMTTTRHYVAEQNGESFVAGDNFNGTTGTVTGRGDDPKQVTEADDTIYLLKFDFEDTSKLPIILTSWRGHPSLNNSDTYDNSSKTVISSDYVNAFCLAMEYGVNVKINKTNNVGNVTDWTLGNQKKYRVAFFNSTGGNTNPRGYELVRDKNGKVLTYGTDNDPILGYTWIDMSASTAPVKGRGPSYGVVLAALGNECITDGKNATVAADGEIESASKTYRADRKTVGCSQLGYDAGKAFQQGQALYNAAYATYTTAKSKYNDYVAAQNKVDNAPYLGELLYGSDRDKAKTAYDSAMAAHNAALEPFVEFMTAHTNNVPTNNPAGTSYAAHPKSPLWTYPWIYKDDEGEVFVIASKFHGSYVMGDWNNGLGIPYTAGIDVTVNAFMIGEDIAFVTIPGEPFDYYFKERGIYTPENNMWNDLVGDTYGRPYILGYTNGWKRYFPNIEAYYYNEGSTTKAVGSYEVHDSDFEAGTGERAVEALDSLLASLEAKTRKAVCPHCGETVSWEPYRGQAKLSTGHYYLCSDFELASQLRFVENCTVCFDLNGNTLTGIGRVFYLDDKLGETLNIIDTSVSQAGIAQGCAGEYGAARAYGGGTVYVGNSCTLNLYTGTLRAYEKTNYSGSSGAVMYAKGTFNMYGGKVEGGTAASFTGQYISSNKPATATRTGQGGAIYLDGTFGLYGGSITGGKLAMITGEVWGDDTVGYGYRQTIEEVEGLWPCVYVTSNSSVILSGNGSVEKLYLAGGTAAKLTVKGVYTGAVELGYPARTVLALDQKVAAAENADVSMASITFQNTEGLTAAIKGADVIVSESPYSYIYCEHCKETLQWTPVTDAELDLSANNKGMKPGHYVLTENVNTAQKQLNPDGANPGTFCFDLAGFEFHGSTRAFYVYNNVTLNLQDSKGGAFVQGDKGANNYGGSFYCQGANAVINVYGITIKGTPVTNLRGSAIFVLNGTVNLYDAVVTGNYSKECGGTIFCSTSAKLNVYGGAVTAGATDGKGKCVYLDATAKMSIAADAVVDEIYLNGKPEAMLTVDATDEAFTGTAALNFVDPVSGAGVDVGDITGAYGLQDAKLSVSDSSLNVIAKGTDLVTVEPAVSLCADATALVGFDTLQQAVTAFEAEAEDGQFLRLNADVAETVAVSKDLYLDLNGHELTGNVTVADGAMLYCMDSQTDDYTVSDDAGYGRLAGKVTGNVAAVSAGTVSGQESETDSYRAGYVKVTRPDGISFHRVNLQVRSMALRPSVVGVYYQCPFLIDEVAAEEIYSFGVALSIFEIPDENNMDTVCEYSVFNDITSKTASTGTLLQNIMRTKNSDTTNAGNANVRIYGRAYIETEDGIVFGEPVVRSLQEQVAGVDAVWNTLTEIQKQGVLEMYETYETVMENWELPNIQASYNN